MSEIDKIKTAKAQLIESIKYTGSLDDRLNDIEEAFEPLLVQPQLNEYQEIVLEWLKENSTDDSDVMGVILLARNLPPYSKVFKVLMALPAKQQAQVIQAFTEWWLSEHE